MGAATQNVQQRSRQKRNNLASRPSEHATPLGYGHNERLVFDHLRTPIH